MFFEFEYSLEIARLDTPGLRSSDTARREEATSSGRSAICSCLETIEREGQRLELGSLDRRRHENQGSPLTHRGVLECSSLCPSRPSTNLICWGKGLLKIDHGSIEVGVAGRNFLESDRTTARVTVLCYDTPIYY